MLLTEAAFSIAASHSAENCELGACVVSYVPQFVSDVIRNGVPANSLCDPKGSVGQRSLSSMAKRSRSEYWDVGQGT
jgi:hypothetical protein